MNRRHLIQTGLAAFGAGSTGCAAPGAAPQAYEMPMESAPHLRTLMQWPVSVDVYGARDLAAVQTNIVSIANPSVNMSRSP